ncbi:MAG: AsmA-like C-terminal region-containing protein [Bryobacteraceae bacterium]
MTLATSLEKPVERADSTKRFLSRRPWSVPSAVVFVLAIVYIIVIALNWPFTKQALIDVLQERSVRSVTIARFYRTYFLPGCVAEDISFLHRKHKNKPPLISIERLVIQANWGNILTFQRRLSGVRAVRMHLTVPPKQPDGKPNPIMPLTHSKSGPSMTLGTIIADGALLDFIPKDPARKPFRLVVDMLRLDGVGNDQPMTYRARLYNPEPPGQIESKGSFGAWNADDPGNTPVSGSYTYKNANLAAFKAISGTLSSTGRFKGTLDDIEVEGSAEILNFHLSDTSHTTKLTTQFHAAVNATDGNVFLENVVGQLGQTAIAVQGGIASDKGENGKTVSLDIPSVNGRIENLLDLFISAKRPPMTGDVNLRAHATIPPGGQPFLKRLRMQGDFGIGAGKFTDKDTQDSISHLSESAKKESKAQRKEDPETVLSDLKGHASINNGIATLSNVSFTVPGATASLHGTYNLINYNVDLHGTVVTTGDPADATSGFKSFLVKAITPFFKRKGHAKVVPFKITGPYQNTVIALDIGPQKK